MLRCYSALIKLADPDSAVHAEAILDHHADYHAAVARAEDGQPELPITLPAEDLAHAVQLSLSLVRVTGHRPVRVEVMTSDEFDRRG
jgi:hypothetical protein